MTATCLPPHEEQHEEQTILLPLLSSLPSASLRHCYWHEWRDALRLLLFS